MQRSSHIATFLPFVLATLGGALLSGCGAGNDGQPGASNSAADYAATMAYCGSVEQSGNSSQPGGWDISSPSHSSSPLYDVSALVSAGGAAGPASLSQPLLVEIHDYRNVTGSFIPAGYMEPEWKMGINFLPVFPAKSAACVVSLGKMVSLAGPGQLASYALSWRSKWSTSVPVNLVPGKVIDGFEFVSDFVPQGAQTFFVVSKQRLPDARGVSICFLAPTATQWQCTSAAAADRGANWQFSRAGGEPGVYVVAASQ